MDADGEPRGDHRDSGDVADELDVPSSPPDPETTEHVLPDEELRYPTFGFPEGSVSPDDGFDLERDLDREEMAAWLEDLAGALRSHDAAVEAPDRRVTFGVGAGDVRMAFDPDEDHRGIIEATFTLPAAALKYEDAEARPTGSRGGRGFIPFAMLTSDDRDPGSYRCYNWIEDPTATARGDGPAGDEGEECSVDDEDPTAGDDEA